MYTRIYNLSMGVTLITGGGGQDATILSHLLPLTEAIVLLKRPKVTSVIGAGELPSLIRKSFQKSRVISLDCNLNSHNLISTLVRLLQPSRIFHLAAIHGPSHFILSDSHTSQAQRNLHVEMTRHLLEAVGEHAPMSTFIYAGSSRMYSGLIKKDSDVMIDEKTTPNPVDRYGETKAEGFALTCAYRNTFCLRAGTAIFFNHESPFRQKGYLSQDLANSLSDLLVGKKTSVTLRNMKARTDWSDARDVMLGVLAMTNAERLRDFVFASGECQSVLQVMEKTLGVLGGPTQIEARSTSGAPSSGGLYGSNSLALEKLSWLGTRPIEFTIAEMTRRVRRGVESGLAHSKSNPNK